MIETQLEHRQHRSDKHSQENNDASRDNTRCNRPQSSKQDDTNVPTQRATYSNRYDANTWESTGDVDCRPRRYPKHHDRPLAGFNADNYNNRGDAGDQLMIAIAMTVIPELLMARNCVRSLCTLGPKHI